MIKPGRLNHQLTFQRPLRSSDGMGSGGTITWSDALTVWAEKWNVKSSERVEGARNKLNAIHRWHLRFNAAIKTDMRIKWVYSGVAHYQEVLAVTVLDDRNQEMEVLAEEKI